MTESKKKRFVEAVNSTQYKLFQLAEDLEAIAKKTFDKREAYMLEGISARLRKESKELTHEIQLAESK